MTQPELDLETPTPPVGIDAFNRLKAEDEPWLEHCFVPPPGLIEQIAGDRSVIVFGAPSSGKTALYRHLEHLARQNSTLEARLVARWDPAQAPAEAPNSIAAVQMQARQVLDSCVDAVLTHLAHHPQAFAAAPLLTQEVLAWFVHFASRTNLDIRVQQLLREYPAAGPVLTPLLSQPARQILYDDATPNQVATVLVKALRSLGLNGIWVMVDNLEMWAEIDPASLAHQLNLFLSTLSFFEQAHFSYKLFVPAQLEHTLSSSSGLVRRRVDSCRLTWTPATLTAIIERRLQLATGQPNFTLPNLCADPGLPDWLERVGATSPREWLEQISPLIADYLAHTPGRPISGKRWQELRLKNPPRLYFDDDRKQVTVGARRVSLDDVPAKAYEMLRYLHQQPGNAVVSRAELYFLVYLGLDHVPRPGDKHFEALKEYRNIIDNNLLKLRKAIEPDRDNPVLLVTVRGYGVRLNSRW